MSLQRRNLLNTSRLWNSRFPRRSRLVEEEKRTPASVESRSLIIKLVRATRVALHYIKNCSKCKYCITHIRPTTDQIFLRNKIFRFQRHEYGWCGFIVRKFCNRYFLTILIQLIIKGMIQNCHMHALSLFMLIIIMSYLYYLYSAYLMVSFKKYDFALMMLFRFILSADVLIFALAGRLSIVERNVTFRAMCWNFRPFLTQQNFLIFRILKILSRSNF